MIYSFNGLLARSRAARVTLLLLVLIAWYKSTKFVNRLVVTDSLAGFGKGNGSADADAGYAWYAGI